MKYLLSFLPTISTVIMCVLFVLYAPYTHIWIAAASVLITMAAFSIAGVKSLHGHFTLAGDAFMAGSAMLMLCFIEHQYVWLCLLLLIMPVADILRFLYLKTENKEKYAELVHNKTYFIIEICLIIAIVTYIFIWVTYPSFINILCLALGLALFFLGIYIMGNEHIQSLYPKEVRLPSAFIAIPIALAVWMVNENVTTDKIVSSIAVALMSVIVLELDRRRFRSHS